MRVSMVVVAHSMQDSSDVLPSLGHDPKKEKKDRSQKAGHAGCRLKTMGSLFLGGYPVRWICRDRREVLTIIKIAVTPRVAREDV